MKCLSRICKQIIVTISRCTYFNQKYCRFESIFFYFSVNRHFTIKLFGYVHTHVTTNPTVQTLTSTELTIIIVLNYYVEVSVWDMGSILTCACVYFNTNVIFNVSCRETGRGGGDTNGIVIRIATGWKNLGRKLNFCWNEVNKRIFKHLGRKFLTRETVFQWNKQKKKYVLQKYLRKYKNQSRTWLTVTAGTTIHYLFLIKIVNVTSKRRFIILHFLHQIKNQQ